MDFLKKNEKIIGFVGVALIVVGVFLPFVKVSALFITETVSYVQGWEGKLVLVMGIVSALFVAIKKEKLVYLPALVSLIFSIYNIIDVKNKSFGVNVNIGIGFWIIMLGIIALALVTYVEFMKIKDNGGSVKDFFDFKEFATLAQKDTYAPITNMVNNSNNAQPAAQNTAAEFKFCSNCGAKVAASNKFCTSCGNELK